MENTPAWQLIKNVVEGGTTKKTEIINAILLVNPEMNKNTIRTQITVCTVNNISRIHYSQNKKPRSEHNQNDFLYQIDKSTVVIYDPKEHGNWVIEGDGDGKVTISQVKDNNETQSTSELTSDQIEDFKEKEKNAENDWDFRLLAEDVAEEGDKDWARELYKKAEKLTEDCDDYITLAESVANENNLGDKDWARELYKKAEKLAENSDDYRRLADSVCSEDYLGDKDWARELYKKAEENAERLDDYITLAESIVRDDNLGDKEWAKRLKNDIAKKSQMVADELENSLKTSDRSYWLTNGCEDTGECFLKTGSFKPVDNYEEIIKNINELYEDNRYNKNDTLFTILKYDDEIIIHGSTYLLSRHKLIEDSGIVDVADEYIHSILKNMGVPNYTWTDEYDKESSLWKFIVDSSDQTSPINLIEMLVAPNQKVTVQITDTEYGNNELEIEK